MEEIKEWEKDFADKFGTASYPVAPIHDFISSAIDLAVSKEREKTLEIINKLDTVDIKDQTGRIVREQLVSKDLLIDLINTK